MPAPRCWARRSTSAWVDEIYAFPLPDGAAVDGLRMVVGELVIEGEVREREEAAAVYERARREGRKASLMEQERPNLLTTSVANLGSLGEAGVPAGCPGSFLRVHFRRGTYRWFLCRSRASSRPALWRRASGSPSPAQPAGEP